MNSSSTRDLRASVALAAAATMLTLVVIALTGEWLVRHRERTRTSVPGTMSKLFYQHSRLRHVPQRGTDYYGWVSIGRQGFRGSRDVAEATPDSVLRILAVGGSTTFDSNTSGDSSAWPARLEQILDSVAAPQRFEVLNAGVSGYRVFDDLIRFEYELYRYQPDLIILYQGHNDLFSELARAGRSTEMSFVPRPGEIPTVYPWERWLEQHSLLYHKLRSKFAAVRFRSRGEGRLAQTAPRDFDHAVERGAREFGRQVAWYLAIAQSTGARVIVPQVVYAADSSTEAAVRDMERRWRGAIPFAPVSEVMAGYARFDSTLRTMTATAGAIYVSAADSALWRLDGYAMGDPIHFNDRGSWRLAHHLSRTILDLVQSRADSVLAQ